MTAPRSHLGVAFMLGVVAVVGIALIVVRAQTTEEGVSDTAITQAHTQTRSFADPILQLCDQGGDVAARLSAKGLCGAAEIVRAEPAAGAGAAGLTPEQVQALIRAELAKQRPAAPPAPELVPARPSPSVEPQLLPAPLPPAVNYSRPPPVQAPPNRPSTQGRPSRTDPWIPRQQPRQAPSNGPWARPRYAPPGSPGYYRQPQMPQMPYQAPYQQPPYQAPPQQPLPAPGYQQSPPPQPAPQRQPGLLSNLVDGLF